MNGALQLLGVVQDGEFKALAPNRGGIGLPVRLTGIAMQESVPPDSRELVLADYEGKAIMISGHDGGSWIYSAAVIDHAGPILTAVVRQVFGQASASFDTPKGTSER